MIFRTTMRHKEAIISMLIQIVYPLHDEVVVVTPAFNDLCIEDVRDECQEVIVIPASRQNRHPMQIFLDCLFEEAL